MPSRETPLATLSGGQRTRAGLAALVFTEPDFLLLDEPTNNLDRDGRTAVIDLLAGWRSGAIVVSHDRELLDTMDAIVELTTLGATRYGGNWSPYRERKALELAAARHDLADAEKRVADVARTRAGSGRAAGAQGRRGPAGSARKATCRASMLGRLKDRGEDTSGEQCPPRRTPPRAGCRRRRRRPRAHRSPAAALRRAPADWPAGGQDGADARRHHRRLRAGPADHPRSLLHDHRPRTGRRHRAQRLGQDHAAVASSPGTWCHGRERCG